MHVISVVNQKGGVGKTISAGCLAVTFAKRGFRVLAVDLDGQNNLSTLSRVQPTPEGSYMALVPPNDDEPTVDGRVFETSYGFDLVPGSAELAAAENALATAPGGQTHLREALESVADEYDYVVVDAPPNLGLLTLNALVAADVVAVPVKASSFFALKGVETLIRTNKRARVMRGGSTAPLVPFTTLADMRQVMDSRILATLKQEFEIDVVDIPNAVAVEEAAAEKGPYVWVSPDSVIAGKYRALADQLDGALGVAA